MVTTLSPLAAVLARLRRMASLSLVRTVQRLLMYLERRDFVIYHHRDISIERALALVRSFVPTLRQTCSRYNRERHLRSKIR